MLEDILPKTTAQASKFQGILNINPMLFSTAYARSRKDHANQVVQNARELEINPELNELLNFMLSSSLEDVAKQVPKFITQEAFNPHRKNNMQKGLPESELEEYNPDLSNFEIAKNIYQYATKGLFFERINLTDELYLQLSLSDLPIHYVDPAMNISRPPASHDGMNYHTSLRNTNHLIILSDNKYYANKYDAENAPKDPSKILPLLEPRTSLSTKQWKFLQKVEAKQEVPETLYTGTAILKFYKR